MHRPTLTAAALATTLMLGAALAQSPVAMPTLMFSQDAGMNMMLSGTTIDITANPKAKLLSRSMSAQRAVLVYAGTDAKGALAFYDKALKAEGWKVDTSMMAKDKMGGDSMAKDSMTKSGDTTAKDGMTKDGMAKSGDTMAKSGDAMMAKDNMAGNMAAGERGYYVGKDNLKLDVIALAKGDRTTVTISVHR